MATDYAEKERAFIAALSDDTGTDLAGWIARIGGSAHTERNDIIDWLRQQGFSFAKASWIERIHHNGGRLIYADEHNSDVAPAPARTASANANAGRVRATPRRGSTSDEVSNGTAGAPDERNVVAAAALALPPVSGTLNGRGEGVAGVLASAKGLKPLAEVLLAEIGRGGPVETLADPPMLKFSGPRPFAALWPGPKELRFYGDFGTGGGGRIKRAEQTLRLGPPFPQVIVLNDVRQIDQDLRDFISAARERANAQVGP